MTLEMILGAIAVSLLIGGCALEWALRSAITRKCSSKRPA